MGIVSKPSNTTICTRCDQPFTVQPSGDMYHFCTKVLDDIAGHIEASKPAPQHIHTSKVGENYCLDCGQILNPTTSSDKGKTAKSGRRQT